MKERKTNRDLKSEETKKRIINETRKLMRKYGYNNVSIQQICEAANVSSGTVYHFFGSKQKLQEIIYSVVSNQFQEYDLDYERDSPYDLQRRKTEDFIRLVNSIGSEGFFTAAFLNPYGNKTFYDPNRPDIRSVVVSIEGFQNAGKIRNDIPALQVAYDIMDITLGVFFHCYTMDMLDALERETLRMTMPYYNSIVIRDKE